MLPSSPGSPFPPPVSQHDSEKPEGQLLEVTIQLKSLSFCHYRGHPALWRHAGLFGVTGRLNASTVVGQEGCGTPQHVLEGLTWLLLGAAVVISTFPWTSGSREGRSQGSKILEQG